MSEEPEDARVFAPKEYPIKIDIYDAFLKYEMENHKYLHYGIEPEDWHQSYSMFGAGFEAGINLLKEFLKRKMSDD